MRPGARQWSRTTCGAASAVISILCRSHLEDPARGVACDVSRKLCAAGSCQWNQTTERLPMKIVVIGGTGLIGSKVVAKLGEHGHEAVAASPASGVNTLTGEGLDEALAGADVVIDVSNSPSFEDAAVLEFF